MRQSEKKYGYSPGVQPAAASQPTVLCRLASDSILVDSASALATLMHIPEKFIALSVVALGTSLPELVTSLTAIRKKEAGLSIGNIIGANILNIVLVMATSAIVAPGGLTTTVVKSGILQGMDQLLVLDKENVTGRKQ